MIVPLALSALVGSTVLTTIAWYVQQVQYPCLCALPEQERRSYHRLHARGTGAVVVPAMLAEAVGAGGLLWVASGSLLSWLGAAMGAFALGWTFLVSAPLHARIAENPGNDAAIDRLCRTNLPRALAWSAHAILATLQVHQLAG